MTIAASRDRARVTHALCLAGAVCLAAVAGCGEGGGQESDAAAVDDAAIDVSVAVDAAPPDVTADVGTVADAPTEVASAPTCIPVVSKEPVVGDLPDAGLVLDGGMPSAFGLDQRPATTTCLPLPKPTGLAGDPFPTELAATGCFTAGDLREVVTGPIPYDINSPLWSDGAVKRRWLVLPAGEKITLDADGDWEFPIGTMLLKSFQLDGQMLETRFLVHHADGEWDGYTYKWDEGGANRATLLPYDGGERTVGDRAWVFPSRKMCLECHTEAAGFSLGPETAQMNRLFVYPDGRRANQISTFDHIGLFAAAPGNPTKLPAYPSPALASAGTVAVRARAYLHANCSHCHRPGGVMQTFMDLRYDTAIESTNVVNRDPARGNFGLPGVKLLLPGDPDLSMIYVRMSSRIPNVRMPAIGSLEPDGVGLTLIKNWISSLACPSSTGPGK